MSNSVTDLIPENYELSQRLKLIHWQPIEAAPKDGTKILVINNRGNMAVALWQNGWVPMFSNGQPNTFLNGGCGSICTHWMSLPEKPSKAKGE